VFLRLDGIRERVFDQEAIPVRRKHLERGIYEKNYDQERRQESQSLGGFFGQIRQINDREDDEALKDDKKGRGALVDEKKIDSKQ
jgi:hypothetical protein